MEKLEGVFFPGETVESDLGDRIVKKVLLYFDKTYVLLPALFNFRIDATLREYTHRFQPEKLDEFSRDLAIARDTCVMEHREESKSVDKSAREQHKRIMKLLGETDELREEGLLEIINPEENIKTPPYYWDDDTPPAEKFFSIKEKYHDLPAAISESTIMDYIPHLLFGNILEDLHDTPFRNLVKEHFSTQTVTLYKGQAETNWFEALSGGEDIIEMVPSDYFEFGFCSHIPTTMWASLLINHALIAALKKRAVPTCSHPTFQSLLNRKVSRLYEKIAHLAPDTTRPQKELSPFKLVLEKLPHFELKQFGEILEIREKLKDELAEFRQKMCTFTAILQAEPYSTLCEDHLDLLQMDIMQQALDNLRKKISSLHRKTLPKVATRTFLNLSLQVTPALPPSLALLAGTDIFPPATLVRMCENTLKDSPHKNGVSYLITTGKA